MTQWVTEESQWITEESQWIGRAIFDVALSISSSQGMSDQADISISGVSSVQNQLGVDDGADNSLLDSVSIAQSILQASGGEGESNPTSSLPVTKSVSSVGQLTAETLYNLLFNQDIVELADILANVSISNSSVLDTDLSSDNISDGYGAITSVIELSNSGVVTSDLSLNIDAIAGVLSGAGIESEGVVSILGDLMVAAESNIGVSGSF